MSSKNNSLKFYQGTGYGKINSELRENEVTDEMIEKNHKKDEILHHIYNIKESIEDYGKKHMKEYRGIKVYRGITLDIGSLIKNIGNKFIENGFCSVSTDINVALKFTGEKCCILTFILPEIYAYKFDYQGKYREDEYVLERNLMFYDIEKSESKYNDKTIYTCKVKRYIPEKKEKNEDIENYITRMRKKMLEEEEDIDTLFDD